MPIVRCSKEVYDYVTKLAMDTGQPVSITLDRWLMKELEAGKSPKPEPKSEYWCKHCERYHYGNSMVGKSHKGYEDKNHKGIYPTIKLS